MTPDRYQLVKRIFRDVSQSDPGQRAAVLDRECGDDDELRTEVLSLLSQDEHTDDFLSRSPAFDHEQLWQAAQRTAAARPRPHRIGQYRILDVLGEGGMGVVYLAEQDNPRRNVALKVIRPGVASEPMLRRFEFEAQLLGRLHHHGIAQIYEAGTADAGDGPQPYFAMELVEGLSLSDYLKKENPSIHQRLELLAIICEAVHHAHQKGVIHRDLKPGNILVTGEAVKPSHEQDGERPQRSMPHPKILDFGVARAVDRDSADQSMRTVAGAIVGTISYMSPEQVAGDPHDVDIRADVFSLGVIYYEVLSGRLPHDLERKTLPESMRIVQEAEIKPLGAINRAFRGDLETIVGKALEKDRARRYQSALELAEDTRRFLRNQPISARPPTTLYLARKFVKRNKVMVAAILALLIGAIGTTWQAVRATGEKQRLNTVLELKDTMEDPLTPAVSDLGKLRAVSIVATEKERAYPEIAADLHTALGLNYMKLAYYDDADAQLSRALRLRESIFAPPHKDLAESHYNLGRVQWYEGRYHEAVEQYSFALQMRRALRPANNPDSEDVARTLDLLATAYRKLGEDATAESTAREALAMRIRIHGENHWEVAASKTNLALCLNSQDRHAEAAVLFRDALGMIRRLAPNPAEDLRIAAAMTSLADCLIDLQQWDEADQLAQDALRMKQRGYPGDHPSTANSLMVLARLRHTQGLQVEAEQLCRRALHMQQVTLPAGHIDFAMTQSLLGSILLSANRTADAEAPLRDALAIRIQQLPAGHPHIAEVQGLLGDCLQSLGLFREAESLLHAAYETCLTAYGPDDARTQAAAERWQALIDATDTEQQSPQ